ncbi:hypothetical protein J4460_06955 [Candidatus Woesearchaeota archaeon]|nr:MAG: hypothetical protein QS99_C0018G0042 [archaeon GW2011_AR4]MBS3130379.1 hypothetical protein [Candidatus Woesearchaeota archaeon]HIH38244.1 hypothetical protein [Candidatus Woesearchaeota archaeon]HIH49091.1 hypothetical protein [Candidatus Woesearchaeota archaeon]HIJ04170.1 hypothetical protein [Candidatus Woesearchaeota archaeon]
MTETLDYGLDPRELSLLADRYCYEGKLLDRRQKQGNGHSPTPGSLHRTILWMDDSYSAVQDLVRENPCFPRTPLEGDLLARLTTSYETIKARIGLAYDTAAGR